MRCAGTRLLAILLMVSAAALAGPVKIIKDPASFEPKAHQGIQLFVIDTDQELRMVKVRKTGSSAEYVAFKKIDKGRSVHAVRMDAGEYGVSTIYADGYWTYSFAWGQSYFEFVVEPGAVNYFGDIVVRNPADDKDAYISIVNRSAMLLNAIEEQGLKFKSDLPFVYGGRGKDDYFVRAGYATDVEPDTSKD